MDIRSIKGRIKALSNIPKFLKLVYETSPSLTISNLSARLMLAVLPVSVLYVGKLLIDQIILINSSGNKGSSQAEVWKYVAIEGLLLIAINVLNRVVTHLDNLLGDLYANYTSIKIMEHAARLDLEQFEDSEFYNMFKRARQQTENRAVLLSQVFGQVQDFITLGFLGVTLILFTPWFTFILLLSSVPSIIGESYFNSKHYLLTRSQINRKRELEYLSFLGASDQSAKEVRMFDLSGYLIGKFKIIADKLYVDSKRLGTKRVVLGGVLTSITIFGYYAAFIYVIKRVIDGYLSVGDFTFFLGSIRTLSGVLQGATRKFSQMSQGALYLKDFFEFFDIQSKIMNATKPLPFPKPIIQGLVFENVGFKYHNSKNWANRNLNFTLNAGEKLALVGENGAGKTTLVKLLARLYDPTEGRILLDGHDLKEYDIKELWANIGIIFQDYLRYQMTVAENISIGNITQIDNRELIAKAAQKSLANLMIERLSEKYDQMLGRHFENGVELSGGEWQKVALARAYMRDAQLMILDEPTAALDARAEYEVFERFSELTKDKMAILISHRFSTVRMADRILVLEKGELKEIGSHDELLRKGGKYAELFHLQAIGYQ